jgi:hypothetical protein
MKLPIFIPNSRLILLIRKLPIPINPMAISLIFWVISSEELDDVVKNHETIHYRQWIECGILFFGILYVYFYFYNLLFKGMTTKDSYYNIPFEREAYANQDNLNYIEERPKFNWRNYYA